MAFGGAPVPDIKFVGGACAAIQRLTGSGQGAAVDPD
jgi:hypothetical protein